ncbi:MAG: ArsR family transcriptional regulator [Candidatus Nanohaloarchaea archaeon]
MKLPPGQRPDASELYTLEEADREVREEVPPSGKLVYYTLKQEGEMSQPALRDETLLDERTVRKGLEDLDEVDVVYDRPNLMDARSDIYGLKIDEFLEGDGHGTD